MFIKFHLVLGLLDSDFVCSEIYTTQTLHVLFFCIFRATHREYGSSQARGRIGAAASGLHHRHSNTGSEPSLQTTVQLTEMLDT